MNKENYNRSNWKYLLIVINFYIYHIMLNNDKRQTFLLLVLFRGYLNFQQQYLNKLFIYLKNFIKFLLHPRQGLHTSFYQIIIIDISHLIDLMNPFYILIKNYSISISKPLKCCKTAIRGDYANFGDTFDDNYANISHN